MKERTITALNALNRRFYDRLFEPFDGTRRRPWPGWSRLLELDDFPARPRVRDVGCGNGRFLAFLEEAGVRPRSYHGVDFCAPLLDIARSRRPGVSWELRDLLAEPGGQEPGGDVDLVVVFGVLHHVPGEDRRRRLLEQCTGRLAPGGLLAVAFWRFLRSRRLCGHRVPWTDAPQVGVDPDDLERGDCLLTFGAPGPLRFCHDCDEDEQERLTAPLPLTRVAGYESDGDLGRLNQYVVMRRDH